MSFARSLLALAIGAVPALANPIVYTSDFTATGTIGAQGFSGAAVQLVFVGDTTNVFTDGVGILRNVIGTATLTIAGLGSSTFTSPIGVFANQKFSPPAAGFFDNSSSGSLVATLSSGFAAYTLGPIGPTLGSSFFRSDLSYNTTNGALNFSAVSSSTFAASQVPEPSSVGLVLGGLAALAAVRLRRR